jgi:hypothetical protein
MRSTILFIAIMVMLIKYSSISKSWLWFALITGLLVRCGYEIGLVSMVVFVVLWKILKDVYNQL